MQKALQARAAGLAPAFALPCCFGRRAQPPARPCSRRQLVAVEARKRISEADLYVAVDGRPAPRALEQQQQAPPPWYVVAPLALAGLVVTLRTIKLLRKKL